MDEELRALAELALRNAFYRDFSDLVNLYLEVGTGLDVGRLESQFSDTANVYSRDTSRAGPLVREVTARILGEDEAGTFIQDRLYESLVSALQDEATIEVWLHDVKAFERREGEWHYVEDEE